MVVSDANIHNIMGGMESTAGVRLHNHRRKLKQRFDIVKKLGQGTYGKVQLGINKETGQEVAIKTIKKAKIETEADLVRIRREIQIMSSVQHPNIIHIYEVFENREKMVLVMEYAAGGELYDYLSERKVLAQEEARRIFRQIATAVYYCHKHKICHRDLKLENILLDEHGSAKIADFGLSNVFDEQRLLNTFCGSPLYASPEIVKGTPYHGPEVDCWSLGVLLYTLVYGAMPFDGSNFKRLVKQISQGDYFEPKKPSPASPLIRDMLTVVPARRADIEKICAHWWVNEGHTESCLEIAEELAGQTPVRLDLLLSLAPPGPGVGSDKLLVTKEQDSNNSSTGNGSLTPARCHSVGSLMELDRPAAELRLQGFDKEKRRGSGNGDTPKRKLEEGVSSEEANQGGAKRKERSRRRERERSSDRRQHRSSSRNKQTVETSPELKKDSSNRVSQESMDIDVEMSASAVQEAQRSLGESEETIVGSLEAVVSSVETIGSSSAINEVISKSSEKIPLTKKSVKKQNKPTSEAVGSTEDREAQKLDKSIDKPTNEGVSAGETAEEVKVKVKRKKQGLSDWKEDTTAEVELAVVNKEEGDVRSKASGISNTNSSHEPNGVEVSSEAVVDTCASLETNISLNAASKPIEVPKKTGLKTRKSKGELSLSKLGSSSEKSSGTNTPEDVASPPSRPVERRRSKIFETAEKFNNFLAGSTEPKSPTSEKPKKVFIPGVKVSDAKRAFERKSSLPDTSILTQLKTPASKKTTETRVEPSSKSTSPRNDEGNEGSVIQRCEQNNDTVSETKSNSKVVKDIEQNETSNDTLKKQQSSNTCQIKADNKIDKVVNDTTDEMIGHNSIQEEANLQLVPALQVTGKSAQQEEARIKKLKDAVEIISNAIAEESRKDTLPDLGKKTNTAKPPVPLSADVKARAKGIGISSPSSPKSPPLSSPGLTAGKKMVCVQVAPNEVRLATIDVGAPETTKFPFSESAVNNLKTEKGELEGVERSKQTAGVAPMKSDSGVTESTKGVGVEDGKGKKKLAKVEITLKSATLPRRRTSKAEIQLGSPRGSDTAPTGGFRTEVEHMVAGVPPARFPTQRSEVAFPIVAAVPMRSASLEPEGTSNKPRERIIPIRVEGDGGEAPPVSGQPLARPPVPPLQQQRSLSQSQRSGSLSRQSTQDSDTDVGPEPIRKSPREYIIPIAVEGGGYITPRAGSLEPSASDEANFKPKQRSAGRVSRPRRMSSLLSDASEDEGFNSPFASLQRHSSLGRDDNPDDDRSFHMHRLRSSRPSRRPLERNDSLSSAEEEDDDDDGFEILTAESLFSTLLSRVRSLTQRLNVEDSPRPGFPTSRLMNQLSNMGHATPSSLWNQEDPLSRRLSESSQFSRSFSRDGDLGSMPWRRSTSRDVSDCDSVYSESGSTTSTLPRGSSRHNFGACDDTASKLTSTSSYPYHYTPSLARRISRHYKEPDEEELKDYPLGLSRSQDNGHCPSTSSRSLVRTMSMRSTAEDKLRSGSRRDYLPSTQRSMSLQESKDSENSGELFHSKSLHGTSLSDVEDNMKRRDYQPPTRRSLRLLDDVRSAPLHRGSSASDSDYSNYKSWETGRILPPLPRNVSTYNRRRDPHLPRPSYGRQRSSEVIDSLYASQEIASNRRLHSRILEVVGEDVQDRPRHSSSLPSIARSKMKNVRTNVGTTLPSSDVVQKSAFVSGIIEKQNDKSNYENNVKETDKSSGNSVSGSEKGDLKNDDSINNAVVESELTHCNQKTNLRNVDNSEYQEKRGRSQIPSLLRFRSSSLSRESERNKSKTTATEDPHSLHNEVCKSSRSIPDRSILSKFFRSGSEERRKETSSDHLLDCDNTNKKSRRISRFLRPDFFDTPPEESSYVKEKEAQKAAEADQKRVKRLARRAALMEKKENGARKLVRADAEIQASKEPILATYVPQTLSKEGETVSNQNKMKIGGDREVAISKNSSPEKQISGTGNKNRFLHSLEKKLERFRASGDDILSSTASGKSRVEKAIHSLREYSTSSQGSDLTSESNLLKRAVSVDDVCATSQSSFAKENGSSSSKFGCKVSSVLGLFRKMEDSPRSTSRPAPVLSRLRRTQSVYAGSHSDSVLLTQPQENLNLTCTKPQQKPVICEKDNLSTLNNAASADVPAKIEAVRNVEISVTTPSCSVENSTVGSAAGPKSTACSHDTDMKAASSDTKILKKIRSKSKVIQKEGAVEDKSKQISSATTDIPENATRKCRPKKCVLGPSTDKLVKPGNSHENPEVVPKQDDNRFILSDKENMMSTPESVQEKSTLGSMLTPCNQYIEGKAALVKTVSRRNVKQGRNCDGVTCPNTIVGDKNSLEHSQNNIKSEVSSGEIEQVQSKTVVIPNGATSVHKDQPYTVGETVLPTVNGKDSCDCISRNGSMKEEEIKSACEEQLDCYSSQPNNACIGGMENCDSWSVCSDTEEQDLSASLLPFSLDDEGKESVEDRIRRKSFYSRFNDIKKKGHRKTILRDNSSRPTASLPSGKTHRSKSLHSTENVEDRLTSSGQKLPVPSRSSHKCSENRSNSLDIDMNSSESHNGCSYSPQFEENSKLLREESVDMENFSSPSDVSQYASGHVYKNPNVAVSSCNNGDTVPCSNATVRQRKSSGQLLRPAVFTQEGARNFSLNKSRLPTASRENCGVTLGTTRPPTSGNCSSKAGTYAVEGEKSLLNEKYNRFNTEPPPSS